ncbi:hypothetical protein KC354_g4827 [Hortaea werneckii]|nr:hypothetical protein KC354_g4827 [Hortaea werneckii]
MAAGALHSDHINYLIYRYLQEHGHENAAIAFHRDWHRPHEFRDPENLPFAHVLKRHALVSVVQDGLLYDELAARGRKWDRKFKWTGVNPRVPLEEQNDAVARGALENGTAGVASSRPGSSGKRKGRVAPATKVAEDFPTPAPKRQRRTENEESGNAQQVNGDKDGMDVDAVSPSADVDEDPDAVSGSPHVVSDTEIVEVPERYDSMDVATQTEVKTGPKTSTMYWKIDKPGAHVLHSMWNPDATNGKNVRSLLTVGESLCRVYEIPESLGNAKEISHVDQPKLPAESVVTATAWHPSGHSAASAIDGVRHLAGEKSQPSQYILQHSQDFGSAILDASSKLLEPASIVLCLRYSPKGDYILVARTNLVRGMIQIWRSLDLKRDNEGGVLAVDDSEPIAWRIFEKQVLDACWASDDAFLVCGDKGLASAYQLDEKAKTEGDFTADNVAIQGLTEKKSNISGQDCKWDKLRFDERLGTAILASTEAKMMITRSIHPELGGDEDMTGDQADTEGSLSLSGQLTALASVSNGSYSTPGSRSDEANVETQKSLIAAAFEEGFTTIYKLTRSSETSSPKYAELLRLDLADWTTPLAISWSSQGSHLAIAGTSLVQVWRTENLFRQEREGSEKSSSPQPLVTWRSEHLTSHGKRNGERNGEEHEVNGEDGVSEPSLSWSADGESLGFAVGKEMAIIRFRPSLHSTGTHSEIEVHGSS